MKYFEPQQTNYGSALRNSVPPYGIAPHMLVAYPRSISPIPSSAAVHSWSNPTNKPDVVPTTLPAAVSPTISPLKAVASSNLFNFKLAPSLNDYSCRRSVDFEGAQKTSANYSPSGESSPPLPSWFKQEQLAARQIQAKLNLA